MRHAGFRTALTLIETLAAVVLLGVLAAAVVPAVQSLAVMQQRLIDRSEAEAALRQLLARPLRRQLGQVLDATRGWRLDVVPLEVHPPAVTAVPLPSLPRTWVHVVIRAGDIRLAEAVTVAADEVP